MEQFADYSTAIMATAGVAIFGLLISPFTALRKMGQGIDPGGAPAASYDDPVYRFNRAYLNLTENMGFYLACLLAAMLAGVAAWWVNTLALVFFLSRLLVFVVHLAGIGPKNMGPRTMIFVAGWGASLALAVLAVLALI